ncbi:MAG: hypothetical protein QW607_04405 [Desulfurococcaceae archaeon]
MRENRYTTIAVPEEVFKELDKLRGKKTWADFLLEAVKGQKGEIVFFPDNINLEDVLTAIEKVKPPSKWSDMFKYFIVFFLAGTGLGLFLPW